MSPGNLSRLENGDHGPPADEVIAKLATILDMDVAELYKLAGRDVGGASFEGGRSAANGCGPVDFAVGCHCVPMILHRTDGFWG